MLDKEQAPQDLQQKARLLALLRDKKASQQKLITNPRALSGRDNKPFIYDLNEEEIKEWCESHNYPKFKVKQLMAWIQKGIEDKDELTDFNKKMREELAESFDLAGLTLTKLYKSKLDATTKYVYTLADGNGVEAVFMEYKHGTSVCLSSQAGCRMGCGFCASTGLGFVRNLSRGELFAQVARIGKHQKRRIDNIVLMGIGEPLENYDEVIAFIRKINDPNGLNIGMRHITLSTCGLVPEIKRLADENIPITLAISLHAPTNALRLSIMPVNKRYPIEQLIDACHYYVNKTKRRLTFEYAMFKEINDTVDCAEKLTKLLRGLHCHINLIPANEFEESPFKRSLPEVIEKFQKIVAEKGFSCTIRRELGRDISAACGQLRRKLKL